MRIALKLFAPLRCCSGSNHMRGSCQLATAGCWFTPKDNLVLQQWKLTAVYNQIWLKNGSKHRFTTPHQPASVSLIAQLQFYVDIYGADKTRVAHTCTQYQSIAHIGSFICIARRNFSNT